MCRDSVENDFFPALECKTAVIVDQLYMFALKDYGHFEQVLFFSCRHFSK
ncbi:hypothetical protein JM81_1897 [Maribacter sp. MAR_2009_72]|nr:hypothetical protein JM81_1897 [Maribacter sp. MAR_2009_72]